MKKRNLRRGLALALSLALALALAAVPAAAEGETKPTLWIVGDSTACDYAATSDADYFYKRCGFGTALKSYVDSGSYNVQNLAISGESSKSFTGTDNYQTLTGANGIKTGDALIIAFGHNDEKSDDAARYTTPNGTSTTEGSFANSLYVNYVKVAQDAGAQPILCTPIVRRTTSTTWGDDKLHKANGGDYAEDIRNLGREVSVPVVDMTTSTKAKYDEVGVAETANFHAWKRDKTVDNTHLNTYGAYVVAQLLATEIAKLTDLDLAAHVNANAVAPDKAVHLVQNPDWDDPSDDPYAPPTTSSEQCEDYVIGDIHFKGTAMGYLGGDPSAANHVRETDENGNMHIAVKNNKGKIESNDDGIVMYYYPVPADMPFTLSAKATVNSVGDSNPNQAAFGLMARDDMYIDVRDDSLNGNYVVAGTFGNGACANFARKDGTLNKSSATLANAVAAGQSYDLQITRSVDGNYACTIDGVSVRYDYSIDSTDTVYTYVGMFCARSFDVTFSDISLTVDDGTVAFTGALDAAGGAGAATLAAVYDAQGKMTALKAITPINGNIALGLKMAAGELAKVFVLGQDTLAPLLAEPLTKPSPATGN